MKRRNGASAAPDQEQEIELDAARWSGFRDAFGEREAGVDSDGCSIELLRLPAEFTPTEAALIDRIARLIDVDHPGLARARRVVRDDSGRRLVLVSERAPGVRLSELLRRAAAQSRPAAPGAAIFLWRRLAAIVAAVQRTAGIPHLAIAPDRIVITPRGEVVVVEAAVAAGVEALASMSRNAVAMLPLAFAGADAARLSSRIDTARAAIAGVSLLLGRPLDAGIDLDPLSPEVQEASDVIAITAGHDLAAAVRLWIDRALMLDSEFSFQDVEDAAGALNQLKPSAGSAAASRRALLSFVQGLGVTHGADAGALEADRVTMIRTRRAQARRQPPRADEAFSLDQVARELGLPPREEALQESPAELEAHNSVVGRGGAGEAAQKAAREAIERAEREARVQAERARLAREKAQREARETAEREAREKAERERRAHEKAEREVREKAERERLAREKAEREAREKAEREAREKAEREAREKAERERLAREEAEREAREKAEREARERAEREAREKAERERLAREKAEREAREKAEREARERAEREAREKAEREAREKAERERLAREKAEREAREKAEREAREQAEREAREKAEREAREKAEREAREKAERERLAREEAESETREKAEREAREKAEREAREKAEREERERLAREKAERKAREKAERKAREQAEREAREQEERNEAARREVSDDLSGQDEAARAEWIRSITAQLGLSQKAAATAPTLPPLPIVPSDEPAPDPERRDSFDAPLPDGTLDSDRADASSPIGDEDSQDRIADDAALVEALRQTAARAMSEPDSDSPPAKAHRAIKLPSLPALPSLPSIPKMPALPSLPKMPRIPRPSARLLKRLAAAIALTAGAAGLYVGGQLLYSRMTRPGVVRIETTPPGAEVSVDGVMRGPSPVTVQLKPGRYTVAVERAGVSQQRTVSVAAGRELTERIDLSAVKPLGTLEVTSDPTNAQVSVDGTARGVTPLVLSDLSPGRHRVTIESTAGTVTRQVDITAGATATLTESIFAGWIAVFAPFEVEARENGKLLGNTDSGQIMMPSGSHKVDLVSPRLGYRETRTVVVNPGKTTAINVQEAQGTLRIAALEGAEVRVDGVPVGIAPIPELRVPLGTREVVVTHPSIGERRQTITVTASTPAIVQLP